MRPFVIVALTLSACNSSIIDTQNTKPDDTGTLVNPDPDIALSTATLDFGDVHYGERVTTSVTLYNHGGGSLVVSAITATDPVSVSVSTVNVAPGGSTTVTVAIQPVTYATFADPIVFTSNDPDTPDLELAVSAATITDEDGDGHDVEAAGGDDCDDTAAAVHPGAAEEWYNGVDNDCSGGSDWDQDGDGFETDAHNANPETGGGDCQDLNPDYHPGAPDEPYDGADTDCGGGDDYDVDGDGYRSDDFGAGTDCDDDDPTINVEGRETLNGKDDDCDGEVDAAATPVGAPYAWAAPGSFDRGGYSVAMGDLDDDGWAEVIVGVMGSGASGATAAGRGGVGVFYSNTLAASGTDIDDADTWFRGDSNGDTMGSFVTILGDYDGDGGPDVAIGATGTSSNSGTVYLVSGEDLMLGGDHNDAFVTFSGSASNYLGRGIGTDLDLDGDGLQELVTAYATGGVNYVALDYGGSSSGAVNIANVDARYSTDGNESQFYRNMAVGGDLNGDGTQDLVLCDGNADPGTTDGGALWALWGSPTRYTNADVEDLDTIATVLVAGADSAHEAWACQMGDDLDGDGFQDLWIYNQGAGLYAVAGGPSRVVPFDPAEAAMVSYTWHSSSGDAESIRNIGDWTGDGRSEIAVYMDDSAYGSVDVFSSELRSGVWPQRDGRIADLSGSSEASSGNLGFGMAPLPADVDADGDADLAMGDPEYSGTKGSAYVFLNGLE